MKTPFLRRMHRCLPIVLFFTLAGLCRPAQAAILYVRAAATGANNGSSWADAYTSLQSALSAAAAGDAVWVAAGVYTPSVQVDVDGGGGPDPREAAFRLPDNVKVYGGFAGTETLLAERDWAAHPTILSGDIDHNDADADGNSIAETPADIVGGNAYHVVYTRNVSAATWLDGCIVTAGRAFLASPPDLNAPHLDGGGWYNHIAAPANASSPTLRNCTFRGNYAESEGAGFYTTPSAAFATMESLIQGCAFLSNQANLAGGAIFLGSFAKGRYRPVISRCAFTDNQALRRGGALAFTGDSARVDTCAFRQNRVTVVAADVTRPGSGGAVCLTASKTGFRRCMFLGNSATGNATGAFEGGGGGAVYVSVNEPQTLALGGARPVFIGCGFYQNAAGGNTAAWGGAAVHLSDAGVLQATYVNCVFSGNSAQHDGGAVASFARVIIPPAFQPLLQADFTNCTFQANAAGRDGGGLYNKGYVSQGVEMLRVRLENCLLHGNTALATGPQLRNQGNVATVAYSLVQGSGGSGGAWNPATGTDGTNNLDGGPAFVNAADPDGPDDQPGTADDGLRVQAASVAINAGNNAAAGLAGAGTAFAGEARLQGSRVDMGAYERTKPAVFLPKIYWLYPWKPLPPHCLSCPWALRLTPETAKARPQEFAWQGPARLVDYGDSAVVRGRIGSRDDRSLQFEVYLKLVRPHDWQGWSALGRTYSAETPEAERAAAANHADWTYWELSRESRLVGAGRVKGTLQLRHAPDNLKTGFQLGAGANARDGDFGLGGTFLYEGTLARKGGRGWEEWRAAGAGSLNADAQACRKGCGSRPARLDAGALPEEAAPLIYPNPARESVVLEWPGAGPHPAVQVFDALGRQVRPHMAAEGSGRQVVHTQHLAPGVYYLRVQPQGGPARQYKVVVAK